MKYTPDGWAIQEHANESVPAAMVNGMKIQRARMNEHAILRMPDDMADGFESMKLAIMRNKYDGWREFSEDDTLQVLWVLMQLAMDKTVVAAKNGRE